VKNYAGHTGKELDDALALELGAAGIPVERWPEFVRDHHTEVHSVVRGVYYGWLFERAWYYWKVKGPGLPLQYANPLHEAHGQYVRVAGDCGCPSPMEWYKGFAVPDLSRGHTGGPEGSYGCACPTCGLMQDTEKTEPVVERYRPVF